MLIEGDWGSGFDLRRDRRPNDLRHTAASLWICPGVAIKTVSSWLGHSSTKVTLDTYGT